MTRGLELLSYGESMTGEEKVLWGTLFWAFRIKKEHTRKIEGDILPRPVVTEQRNMFKLKVSRFRQGTRRKFILSTVRP